MELAEDTISQLRVLCGHQKGGGVGRRRSSATATLGGLLNRPITKAVILAANKADLARKRCVSTEGKLLTVLNLSTKRKQAYCR